MPRIKYRDIKFSPASLTMIHTAIGILAEYSQRGMVITLRQLYYQFVARDLIPNKQTEYKRLGSVINDARLAGLIDWDFLQDRTRNLESRSKWTSPAQVILAAARSYHRDLWEKQKQRVEVWIEKDALVGVIEGVCERYDVAYFSCRGYTSQSEMWSASQRLIQYNDMGLDVTILHLGDHDPSGRDMTRDITDRLRLFGADVDVHRIALNMDQIRQYNPPPNPAKITDSRAQDYIAEFGPESWELDALDPDVLIRLIDSNIQDRLDGDAFNATVDEIETERKVLTAAANHWLAVNDHITTTWPEEV